MSRSRILLTCAAAVGVSTSFVAAAQSTVPLIPREALFGNPEKAAVRISPDGKWLSWIAPREGVLNIWVAPASDLSKAKPITSETLRPIRS